MSFTKKTHCSAETFLEKLLSRKARQSGDKSPLSSKLVKHGWENNTIYFLFKEPFKKMLNKFNNC